MSDTNDDTINPTNPDDFFYRHFEPIWVMTVNAYVRAKRIGDEAAAGVHWALISALDAAHPQHVARFEAKFLPKPAEPNVDTATANSVPLAPAATGVNPTVDMTALAAAVNGDPRNAAPDGDPWNVDATATNATPVTG